MKQDIFDYQKEKLSKELLNIMKIHELKKKAIAGFIQGKIGLENRHKNC